MATFALDTIVPVARTVLWAYDCEKGHPSPLVDPIAVGVATVLVGNDEGGRISCTLVSSETHRCFNGDTSGFYPSTLEFWNKFPDTLQSLRSDQTPRDVQHKVAASFAAAQALAKTEGASFVPITDCAEFDWGVLGVQSVRHTDAQRPMPLWGPDQAAMHDPADISQMTASFLMSVLPEFNPASDSAKATLKKHFPEKSRPVWAKGNTHEPSEDAAEIAWRYVNLLEVMQAARAIARKRRD